MLDRDLAELYGVETKRLKEQVRRNIERFPDDFMFELSKSEFTNWRSQFATSNRDKIGLRYPKAIADEDNIKHHFANDLVPTPGASEIAGNLITLPTHMGITKTLAREIAQKVKDAY